MTNKSVIFGEDGKVCMNTESEQTITLVEACNEVSNLLEEAKSDLMEIGGVMFGIEHREEHPKDPSCLMEKMENNIGELGRIVYTLKEFKQRLF